MMMVLTSALLACAVEGPTAVPPTPTVRPATATS